MHDTVYETDSICGFFHHKGLVLEMFPPEDLTSSCKYPEHGTAAVQVALFCGGGLEKSLAFALNCQNIKHTVIHVN